LSDTQAPVVDTQVPVVVAFRGRQSYGPLAIARSLGRLGVSVYPVAPEGTELSPVFSSRYWEAEMLWDFFERPEMESVGFLQEVGANLVEKHGSRPIFLTTNDWVAIFLERHSDALADYFQFPRPASSIVGRLLNKWDMHVLASQHDIPTPVTAQPTSRAEIDEFVAKTGFPLVVKAADPFVPAPENTIARSQAELENAIEDAVSGETWNFVLQEHIPGGVDSVWMCNGYFGRGDGHGVVFTGKKLRQLSAMGTASLAECAPNDTVASQTYRFMTALGYRGCCGVGWRYDVRDGTYKVLDVNARVSSVFRLFAGANGLDVVRLCYQDLSGQPMGDTAAQEGRKWLDERDIRAVFPGRGDDRVTVREWVKSVRGVQELHWLARDDLGPFGTWLRRKVFRR
jgi:predicted ATP-grasp superfamily ATP-dependent carboligase